MNRNITALILIILAIGVYYTFTKDQMTEARAVKAVNDEYASAIESAKELIKIRDKVLEQYNQVSVEDQERLEKMIPGTVDNIRLVIDLNSIARQHGFSLRNVKAVVSQTAAGQSDKISQIPASGRAGDGISSDIINPVLDTITVSFSATAPYQQFVTFLQSIESNLRIMDVSRLSVVASDSGMYDFGVELKTYWVRQ